MQKHLKEHQPPSLQACKVLSPMCEIMVGVIYIKSLNNNFPTSLIFYFVNSHLVIVNKVGNWQIQTGQWKLTKWKSMKEELGKILGECRTLWGEREQAMHLGVELFCS